MSRCPRNQRGGRLPRCYDAPKDALWSILGLARQERAAGRKMWIRVRVSSGAALARNKARHPAPWAVSRWASPTASKPGGQKTSPPESVPLKATVRRLASNSAPLQISHRWCLRGIDVDETTPSPDKETNCVYASVDKETNCVYASVDVGVPL